jgi:uncharacterized membrane protein YwaF
LKNLLDKTGFVVSSACAVHCICMPLLAAFLPALLAAWFGSHAFGVWMLGITATIASWAIYKGFRAHNRCWPIGFLGTGLGLLCVSEFFLHHFHVSPIMAAHFHMTPATLWRMNYVHYTVSFAGGMLVAISHVLNLIFHRTCHAGRPHTSGCCHKLQ